MTYNAQIYILFGTLNLGPRPRLVDPSRGFHFFSGRGNCIFLAEWLLTAWRPREIYRSNGLSGGLLMLLLLLSKTVQVCVSLLDGGDTAAYTVSMGTHHKDMSFGVTQIGFLHNHCVTSFFCAALTLPRMLIFFACFHPVWVELKVVRRLLWHNGFDLSMFRDRNAFNLSLGNCLI